MKMDLFIYLNGNCREAAAFYADVFHTEVRDLMTYREVPPGEGPPIAEADLDKVMYACAPIGGVNVMFMDVLSGSPFIIGNQLSPTVLLDSVDELNRTYAALSTGASDDLAPHRTFFSELYAMATDKYGVIWQLLYN